MDNQKYVHTEKIHRLTDAEEIVPFIMKLFSPESVVDVGCGLGTFLYIFRKYGVQQVLGIEGDWVNKTKLFINENELLIADLETKIQVNKRFDIALCLEVAEHLSADAAPILVELLVNLSDVIVFSAAVPNQRGQNHINEQWPDYWRELFAQHGFIFYDIFRPEFWNNKHMYWWYKQNMFLVTRQGACQSFTETPILNCVHPQLFMSRTGKEQNAIRELRDLVKKIESFQRGEFALGDYVSSLFRALKYRMRIRTKK